ncbi:putative phosphodiesterase [Gregarina niphandrodes]|uniref:Phosphodiesterase n=1 Tax=Gregarina niphandrodes TaxID=110365 RepID=A0A023AXT1_GRENI|nr:putative phosphodiesterase [Gregarina niphandrodes]EZG43467.1 putative phosphodiesterase [Gregarina niphandrodes]|eukprot:XP_011133318.1 putative phosphodiesterase [Gregarina niphandrodes]
MHSESLLTRQRGVPSNLQRTLMQQYEEATGGLSKMSTHSDRGLLLTGPPQEETEGERDGGEQHKTERELSLERKVSAERKESMEGKVSTERKITRGKRQHSARALAAEMSDTDTSDAEASATTSMSSWGFGLRRRVLNSVLPISPADGMLLHASVDWWPLKFRDPKVEGEFQRSCYMDILRVHHLVVISCWVVAGTILLGFGYSLLINLPSLILRTVEIAVLQISLGVVVIRYNRSEFNVGMFAVICCVLVLQYLQSLTLPSTVVATGEHGLTTAHVWSSKGSYYFDSDAAGKTSPFEVREANTFKYANIGSTWVIFYSLTLINNALGYTQAHAVNYNFMFWIFYLKMRIVTARLDIRRERLFHVEQIAAFMGQAVYSMATCAGQYVQELTARLVYSKEVNAMERVERYLKPASYVRSSIRNKSSAETLLDQLRSVRTLVETCRREFADRKRILAKVEKIGHSIQRCEDLMRAGVMEFGQIQVDHLPEAERHAIEALRDRPRRVQEDEVSYPPRDQTIDQATINLKQLLLPELQTIIHFSWNPEHCLQFCQSPHTASLFDNYPTSPTVQPRLATGRLQQTITPPSKIEPSKTLQANTELPGTGNPGTGNPGTGQLETGQSETGQSEMGQPETGQPEMGQPETGQSEMGQPAMVLVESIRALCAAFPDLTELVVPFCQLGLCMEAATPQNPYSNANTASISTRILVWLLKRFKVLQHLSTTELLTILIVSLGRFVGSPGIFSDSFLWSSNNRLSLLYNDKDVQSGYVGFIIHRLLQMDGCNPFSRISLNDKDDNVTSVLEWISLCSRALSNEEHYSVLGRFKLRVTATDFSTAKNMDDKKVVVALLMRASTFVSQWCALDEQRAHVSSKRLEEYAAQKTMSQEAVMQETVNPLEVTSSAYREAFSQIILSPMIEALEAVDPIGAFENVFSTTLSPEAVDLRLHPSKIQVAGTELPIRIWAAAVNTIHPKEFIENCTQINTWQSEKEWAACPNISLGNVNASA